MAGRTMPQSWIIVVLAVGWIPDSLAFAQNSATPNSATATSEESLARLYGRGVHAYFSGDAIRANDLLNQAIERGSRDPRVYFFRGLALARQNRVAEAFEEFHKGAELESLASDRSAVVSRALERVQGSIRRDIEMARAKARTNAKKETELRNKQVHTEVDAGEGEETREDAPETAAPPTSKTNELSPEKANAEPRDDKVVSEKTPPKLQSEPPELKREQAAEKVAEKPPEKLPTKVVGNSRIGVSARLTGQLIAGSELEARPIVDRKTPLVVRILASYRHGTDYRYDIEYYGLEPGTFNLADYLRRKDGSPTGAVEPMHVAIESRSPAGQLLPSNAPRTRLPSIGGYRWGAAAVVILWAAALMATLLAGRRKAPADAVAIAAPLSPADRLRPLIAAALDRDLSHTEMAELERAMYTYWCHRLGEAESEPAHAMARLRGHPEAGKILRTIESWLHNPEGTPFAGVVAALWPYREVRDEPHSDLSETVAFTPDRERA